jgi:hypothetical protein
VTENGLKGPTSEFMSHCRRELLHAQWGVLLDDELIHAYQHGIVIDCCDGLQRRFYPRFMTYSADYKEKCVLSFCDLYTCLQN